jgi:hypothetical protein
MSVSSSTRAALLGLLCVVATVCAAAEPTSDKTRARMIQLIGKLEADPFAKDGEEIRSEVLTWLTEAPDVTVSVCRDVLGDITRFKDAEGGILALQLAFSEARFILEHPDKALDQHAIKVAGVEGVLRTYASMRVSKPKLAIRQIDEWSRLQTSGQLGPEVDKRLAACGGGTTI